MNLISLGDRVRRLDDLEKALLDVLSEHAARYLPKELL